MTMPNSSTVVSNSVDRATFENLYAGPAPWDIGKPQERFVAIAEWAADLPVEAATARLEKTWSRDLSNNSSLNSVEGVKP